MTGLDAPTLRARNAARLLAQAEIAGSAKPFEKIPVIDIGALFGGESAARQAVGDRIRAACLEVGFFYIRNHHVAPEVYAAGFDAARRFFDLPHAEKDAVSNRNSPVMRGYTGLLEENTDPDNNGDLHEAFDVSLDLSPDDPDCALGVYGWGENLWPDMPDFRAPIMAYHAALRRLSETLYEGFALSLDLPEDYFTPLLTKPIAELRLLHYPPQDPKADEAVIGIGAHSDYSVFTILASDDVPALEVLNPAGDWVAAPPIPGTFIVNVGDLMERWTNDLYRSTVHRAINKTGRRRYSIPFFSNINPLETFEVLPNCTSADRPARYEPVGAAAYVEACMQDAYGLTDN
ncbi:MAG: 2-oxoglutarate and iron-dependent oxygenase domain-containing protein [Roseobacter sp.]|jgi:isopenicillin N synthase-like dioxygenase|nr:2-oxoglutarate and iron-dependent oxygenase domain-containing protein [Roseobacter sp.]